MRYLIWSLIALLFIAIGVHGYPGSIIASFVAPDALEQKIGTY